MVTRTDDERSEQRYDIKVLRREKVTVPAGTFDALYLERDLAFRTQFKDGRVNSGRTKMRVWYAPQAKRFVKFEVDGIDSKSVQSPLARRELLNYQVSQ